MKDAANDLADDIEVDRLYQLPLDQFIPARNELARRRGAGGAPAIRALAKPNVLAWALNQLHWSRRETFDRLVAAAARLRAEQAEALLGKRVDLRAAGEAHREAIRAALTDATAVLEAAGHAATPDAIRELTGALEALPWKDRPGRLVRPPGALGFAALAGLPVATERPATQRPPATEVVPAAPPRPEAAKAREKEEEKRALKAARDAVAAARRQEAETASRLRQAERQLEAARERERAAREGLEDAQRRRSEAEDELRAHEQALQRAREVSAVATRRLVALEQSAETV